MIIMLKIQNWPADLSGFQPDRDDMHKSYFSGVYRDTLKDIERDITYYTYLPEGIHHARPALVSACPAGIHPVDFLEASGLKLHADREELYVCLFSAGRDPAYSAKIMNEICTALIGSHLIVIVRENVYGIGFGSGAAAALYAGMSDPELWSGIAVCGDTRGLRVPEETDEPCALPVWIVSADRNDPLLSYWKRQNRCAEKAYTGDYADEVYCPDRNAEKRNTRNSEYGAELRWTQDDIYVPAEWGERFWGFLRKTRKHLGLAYKDVRKVVELRECAEEHFLMHKGYRRSWWEYVPSSLPQGKKVPLVLMLHGRRQQPEVLFDLSAINEIAEERGFIAAVMSAGVFQMYPDGINNVPLWQGCLNGESFDSVGFLREAVKDMCGRLPVDPSRIYACGFSSGACMAGTISEKLGDVFAAVSCWSGLTSGDAIGKLTDPEDSSAFTDPGVNMPVQVIVGSEDTSFADHQGKYGLKDFMSKYIDWRVQNGKLTDHGTYVTGNLTHDVFANEQGIPVMDIILAEGMPHTVRPFECWLAYDEFLAKYTLGEDGTRYYMGKVIR